MLSCWSLMPLCWNSTPSHFLWIFFISFYLDFSLNNHIGCSLTFLLCKTRCSLQDEVVLNKILDQDPLFKGSISPCLLWSKDKKLTLVETICAHILGRICYVIKGACLICPFICFPIGERRCNHQKVSCHKR
jgi:hypothetical protein